MPSGGFIASNGSGTHDTSAASWTFTTTRAIQAGERVVVVYGYATGGSSGSNSVTVGSLTLTRDKNDVSSRAVEIWSANATALIASGSTVTITLGAVATFKFGSCFSLSNSGAPDVSSSKTFASATALDSGATAAPGTANDIAIGVAHRDPGNSTTLTDTWGTRILDQNDSGANRSMETAYLALSGSPATTATWTASGLVAAACAVVLYKMEICTRRVSTASTANASSYASGSFTPALNELLGVWVHHSATTADAAPTMTDSQGLGFTRVFTRLADNSGTSISFFIANALAAASSMTVTYSCAGSTTPTGALIQVVGITGATKTGAAAIKQSASVDKATNGGSSTTPFATLGANVDTNNVTLGGVTVLQSPAAMTPPTGWTEFDDTGYSSPTTGGEYATRNDGFASTTLTWGNTVVGRWQAGAVEIDMSAAGRVPRNGFIQLPGIGLVSLALVPVLGA